MPVFSMFYGLTILCIFWTRSSITCRISLWSTKVMSVSLPSPQVIRSIWKVCRFWIFPSLMLRDGAIISLLGTASF